MGCVAKRLDDSNGFACLRYVMGTQTYGQKILAALVPGLYKDLSALQNSTRIAYSTIHAWKRGETEPRFEALETILSAVLRDHRISLTVADLLGGRDLSHGPIELHASQLGAHPDWSMAFTRAQERYRNKLPQPMYELARTTSAARWPQHIDETFIYDLADFWHKHGTDEALADAEAADIEAAIDRKQKSQQKR